jgi:BirA family transcriptional regulator, biotin operon repressor / biotin---[acetyl-CoA-carboxylase] ligase
MNETTTSVLRMLKEEGRWVSGQDIGASLDITRSAVSKHIGTLREQGYGIQSSSRRGYLLDSAPNAPYPNEVTPLLTTQFVGRPLLYTYETDSTNSLAAQHAQAGAAQGTTIVADTQSAGRGRLHREWHSPPGTSLYFSIILRPAVAPALVAQLPMVAAVALLQALDRHAPDIGAGVKWPNDILVGGRKLCGILCESEAETDIVHHVIIGMGVNVNTPEFPPELADVATSLRMETGGDASRPELLADVLSAFEGAYSSWLEAQNLEPFLPFLVDRSLITNRTVTVQNVRGEIRGQVSGISAEGGLLLETAEGTVTVVSGDVTLSDWRTDEPAD